MNTGWIYAAMIMTALAEVSLVIVLLDPERNMVSFWNIPATMCLVFAIGACVLSMSRP